MAPDENEIERPHESAPERIGRENLQKTLDAIGSIEVAKASMPDSPVVEGGAPLLSRRGSVPLSGEVALEQPTVVGDQEQAMLADMARRKADEAHDQETA